MHMDAISCILIGLWGTHMTLAWHQLAGGALFRKYLLLLKFSLLQHKLVHLKNKHNISDFYLS